MRTNQTSTLTVDGIPVRLADERAKRGASLVVVYTLATRERLEVSPRRIKGL